MEGEQLTEADRVYLDARSNVLQNASHSREYAGFLTALDAFEQVIRTEAVARLSAEKERALRSLDRLSSAVLGQMPATSLAHEARQVIEDLHREEA